METVYLFIVLFLLCLAVFDLFVGVSNDAVNFLNSAIGAKVAKFRTVMFVASAGVAIGAVMASGMMDVARHGIMQPSNFTFYDVMTIFLAVMVTDVIVLDVFNTLGMPTSTTVSLVFELLGGTFALAAIKTANDPSLQLGDLLNTDKALSVIVAIFVSVAIAFVCGVIVQWIARVVFTFSYRTHSRLGVGIFGGIAFTALAYFIFIKGLGKSPMLDSDFRAYIDANTRLLLLYTFIASTILMQVLHMMRVSVFKLVVLMGTFALAMSFAGNDLVNFIGVPLAGLDSYNDFMANANGQGVETFMMHSLNSSAQTPHVYLLLAGVVMIVAMVTSKKARNVIKTSVDLSRQDEGDEMFGSSRAARSIVRYCQNSSSWVANIIPDSVTRWIDSRFNRQEAELPDGAAFDVVRAAVNLVLASMLITIGTNYKLPLSTTYVTFMVAMGSSLADRAWSRESAVFRVTGVISVIGGWFITAAVAFAACGLVSTTMYYGNVIAKVLFIALVIFIIVNNNRKYKRKEQETAKDDNMFRTILRTRDPEIVWDLLVKHVSNTQSFTAKFAMDTFNSILDGLECERPRTLRKASNALEREKEMLKKFRKQELLALKRAPMDLAIERNTWFHLGINSSEQYIYCLKRMLDPVKEHVDNNFNPIPRQYVEEFQPMRETINQLMKETEEQITTCRFENYRNTLATADRCKDELSVLRKRHIDRIQQNGDETMLKVSLVYLNILQESQQLLSNMRHQLRAAKKFIAN